MEFTKNIIVEGTNGRAMATDIFYNEDKVRQPVIVYVHGFNGFKDWGNFDLAATKFATEGYVLVKFNFSHNGTTPAQPGEFVDLEAFGNNNYTIQLNDLGNIIDWLYDPLNPYESLMDTSQLFLIGHSTGGGICTLKAAQDNRVKKLITWAGISECTTPWGDWPTEKIAEWKKIGVQYYTNGRTKQQMPLYYQLYEDYSQHHQKLNIRKAVGALRIPMLICHGTLDMAVPVQKAYDLTEWQPAAQLFTLESDHVFGRKHPWIEDLLPAAMDAVIEASLKFLQQH